MARSLRAADDFQTNRTCVPLPCGFNSVKLRVMRIRRVIIAAVLLALPVAGCSGGRGGGGRLIPDDFAGPIEDPALAEPTDAVAAEVTHRDQRGSQPLPEVNATPDAGAEGDPVRQRTPSPLTVDQRRAYDVDAMVGQVNGQPIYAREVLKPLDAELEVMGRQLSPEVFRGRLTRPAADGARLIPDRLTGIVIDALILGEAERDLSDQEQFAVKNRLKEIREELLDRFYNSITLAETSLRESTGQGLDETIEGRRKAMIVERYVRQKLLPKVNVTRYDIENYYSMHLDEFNESAGRKVRIVRTDSPTRADEIDAALSAGTSFIEVASSRLNRYKPGDGGLYSERTAGEQIFGPAPLNKAVLALDAGEHSTRIEHGGFHIWLFVEEIDPGQEKSLAEAQAFIRGKLQRLQYTHLFDRYRGRLFASYIDSLKRLQKVGGPDTSLQHMTDMLVDIAVSRYAVLQ